MPLKRAAEGLPQWVSFDSKETPFSQLGDEDLDDVPLQPIVVKKHRIRRAFAGESILAKRNLFMHPSFIHTFEDENYLLPGRIVECPNKNNQYRYRVHWRHKDSIKFFRKVDNVELPSNIREFFHRKDSDLLWTAVSLWRKTFWDEMDAISPPAFAR